MRYGKCFITVLLMCVVLSGCSNSKRDSGKRLTRRIDEARRLFDHATALLAGPPRDKPTTQQSATTRKSPGKDTDAPTVKPVGDPEAETKLAQACEVLKKALKDNPDAPLGTKADALHLLGQIHLADGEYHAATAEHLRSRTGELRRRAHNALALARSNTIQAQFGAKLASLPKGEITTLRDKTAGQLTGLETDIANIDKEMRSKQKDNAKMSEKNAALMQDARKKRDKGEVAGGTKGLALCKQAQVIENEVNDKETEIAANQQAIEVLKFNKARLRRQQQDAQVKLDAIKKRLREIDQFARSRMEDVKTAQQLASERRQEAEELTRKVVECCKEIAKREELAITAFGKDKAGKYLAEAQNTLRSRINEAKAAMRESDKPSEILQANSDEGRLVIIITARGSAALALGDLRSRQIATAKVNAALADAIGQQAPTLAEALKEYLTDADKTRNLAEANYKEAEDQLKGILKLRLKGDIRNTDWNYQAMLANAYLGHYYLTGQSDILTQARDFVDEALDEKEDSQYLKPVVELRQLIQSAQQ